VLQLGEVAIRIDPNQSAAPLQHVPHPPAATDETLRVRAVDLTHTERQRGRLGLNSRLQAVVRSDLDSLARAAVRRRRSAGDGT
jgi:hypothetical protein